MSRIQRQREEGASGTAAAITIGSSSTTYYTHTASGKEYYYYVRVVLSMPWGWADNSLNFIKVWVGGFLDVCTYYLKPPSTAVCLSVALNVHVYFPCQPTWHFHLI